MNYFKTEVNNQERMYEAKKHYLYGGIIEKDDLLYGSQNAYPSNASRRSNKVDRSSFIEQANRKTED